jgi:hypothetical protein
MAKKKSEPRKVPNVAEPPAKATTQARIELPTEEFERVRKVARGLGLSMSAFIRMAVLKEARRVEERRD